MKEAEDGNYEGLVGRLAKGSVDDKAHCLKKLLFLYDNARSRIYLYERRITECLQLALLIEEKDISLNALSLLERIIANTPNESEILGIVRKRLLSKVVLNLGSVEVAIRKVSHKCLLEFLRKSKDLDTLLALYLKTALAQDENCHLHLKAINSLHSLLMAETKTYSHALQNAQALLERLLTTAVAPELPDHRRAALVTILFLLRIRGAEPILRALSPSAQQALNLLKSQNQELAALLQAMLNPGVNEAQEEEDNIPSPKFSCMVEVKEKEEGEQIVAGVGQGQLRVVRQVEYAQQFLKGLEREEGWQMQRIQAFAPFLERCMGEESIKLFSISRKIAEVILSREEGGRREYYVVLVPCIVSGIGNRRFIVRKNIDKLVRQFLPKHTELWVQHLLERFALLHAPKVKDMLLDLVIHAYKTSPEFYLPDPGRPLVVLNPDHADPSLRRKCTDALLLIQHQQQPSQSLPQLHPKTLSDEEPSLESASLVRALMGRKQRMVTAEAEMQRSQEGPTLSEERTKIRREPPFSRERKARNSHIEITFKAMRRDNQQREGRRSKDEKEGTSGQKLPELKRPMNCSGGKGEAESPVKRAMGQRSLLYPEREELQRVQNPRRGLQVLLGQMRDSNWRIQFQGISSLRSLVQFDRELLVQEGLGGVVGQLLANLGNLRSGVTKLALMCLYQMMRALHKRMWPFSEQIVLTLVRRSLTTSDSIQEQIRKCVLASVEQLCVGRVVSALNSVRDSKSYEIRLTFMGWVEQVVRCERAYKREVGWVWEVLVYFWEECQFNLRGECRRLAKLILELHRDWKQEAGSLGQSTLEGIQRLLKSLSGRGDNALWIEIENHQFQKVVLNRGITQKYFQNQFPKFQQLDRGHTARKNWKERIRLMNELVQQATQHPQEFSQTPNAKKYLQLALEHLDDRNPGLLVNALQLLPKLLDHFPQLLQELLPSLLERLAPVLDTRKGDIYALACRLLSRLAVRCDPNRLVKDYLKLLLTHPKGRYDFAGQLVGLLEETKVIEMGAEQEGLNQQSQALLLKALPRLAAEKGDNSWQPKVKELLFAAQRRFGGEFTNKLLATNPKLVEILN